MLQRLVLWVREWADLNTLRSEFPSVQLGVSSGAVPQGDNVVHAPEWWGPPSAELDRRFEGLQSDAGPAAVVVVAESAGEGARLALQVLTRYQHRIGRRNEASRGFAFDQVLRRHRNLHELSHLFVRADYVHALDTWQWLLRLQPDASIALQIAAIFHDVERPIVEPASRSEPVGPGYQAAKDAHARTSARLMRLWLSNLDLDPAVLGAAEALVEAHERPATNHEQALLNEADALSFISRGTDVYPSSLLSWRLRRALSRLRQEGLRRLPLIRCPPEVSRVVEACVPTVLAEPELALAALQ